jgi:hypothetical protein
VIPETFERYRTVDISTKISEFLTAQISKYKINIIGCSRKQHIRDKIKQTICIKISSTLKVPIYGICGHAHKLLANNQTPNQLSSQLKTSNHQSSQDQQV